jgi:hypothetical protein
MANSASDFAAKRLKRTAQGFSPGLKRIQKTPCKWRPRRLARPSVLVQPRRAIILHGFANQPARPHTTPSAATCEAHRSRPRRRPRPREGLLVGIRVGTCVYMPSQNCTPRTRGWRCFQGGFRAGRPRAQARLKPWAVSYSRFAANPADSWAIVRNDSRSRRTPTRPSYKSY